MTTTKPKRAAVKKPEPKSLLDIGSAAGDLWCCLSEGGPMLAESARKKSGLSANVFYAAVGWLAREGKLGIEGNGKDMTLALY